MKKTAQVLLVSVFIISCTAMTCGAYAKDPLQVVFLKPDQNINIETRQIIELIRNNLHQHTKARIRISAKQTDPGFFSDYDSRAEHYIRKVFANYQCEYLMFMRKLDENYYSFELWSSDLVFNHIYLPCNEKMKPVFADAAASAFLSLLYDAEDRLWSSRLY